MSLLNTSHRELKYATENGDLVIFAGAGISKSVGLLLWDELLFKIICHIGTNHRSHADTLLAMFNNKASNRKIFDCLSYIENHSLTGFVNHILLEEIFNKGHKLIDESLPLTLHSKLWTLSNQIITPNYDILFESCSEFKSFNHQPINNKSIISLSNISKYSHYLLKIHGSINEINDIVFYESQYKQQYEANTAIKEKLKELVSNNTMLFVGTSMTDPYINQIIREVNSIFHNTAAKNFILSNDEFPTSDIIRIKGDPISDLDLLLDELLTIKKGQNKAQRQGSVNLPKRLKTLKSAIEEPNDTSGLFPSWDDFENGVIPLNESIYNYVKNRFENHLGPVLCQGRWSTGKTVSTLRVGIELTYDGFTTYYLDLADDIAGQEENILKDYLYKILEKYNNDRTVFIIDNVHLYPEQTYKISQWALNEKSNCIFVGRPLSLQFKERLFYYPNLFEQYEVEDEDTHTEKESFSHESSEEGIVSPKITFTSSVEYVKSMFENRINSIGRLDKIEFQEVEKFAESISFNLSFIAFHVKNITVRTVNIFEINYKLLYDFINDKFCISEFPEELFTIAALSFLDCKSDSRAIFLLDAARKNVFKVRQEHLTERREYFYGMHSATGKLILDLGVKQGLIRLFDNSICYSFDSALKNILEKYLSNKPSNIYEVFFGLSNYEYEAEDINDDKVLEEARELIYYFLSNPKLSSHYSDIVIHRTNSLLKFGFFVKTFLRHKVESVALNKVINHESISKLVATFIEYRKQRNGGYFSLGWHFKYAWVVLRKVDQGLAEFFLSQFPKEYIVEYAANSIGAFSSILEMALYHDSIDELLFVNREKIIGDETIFKTKLKTCNEIKLFFFLRTVLKMSVGNFKNKKLLETIKSYISPEEYRDYVKSLSKITLMSFMTARRVLGRNYSDVLHNSFDQSFVYKLCYDKPLFKINEVISESGWRYFLKFDLQPKMTKTPIGEIATFIRNISLHGTVEKFLEDFIIKLYEGKVFELLVEKLLDTDKEDVFSFFWQLKTLDESLFNKYFNVYCSKAELEFEPLRIERTKTAFSFLFLIYCYSNDIDSKTLLKQVDIDSHVRRTVVGNSFVDKIFIAALSCIFNIPMAIPYNKLNERIRGIHYAEMMFHTLEEERNRFDVYDYLLLWWEGKILLFTASLLGINKIDESILKDPRFEKSVKSYLYDLKLILNNLEQRLPFGSRISDEVLLLNNRISILKLAIKKFN